MDSPIFTAAFDMLATNFNLFIGVLLVACIVFLLLPSSLPYARHEALFSAAERNFFFALQVAVGHRYAIFGKVRVADLVKVTRKTSDKRGYTALARIAQKHIDFVLCDPRTLAFG